MRLKKITKLKNGNLLFAFWANNRGRENSNCTLQVVPAGTPRPERSALTEGVITQTRTSSWRGDVNVSMRVCDELDIERDDIMLDV